MSFRFVKNCLDIASNDIYIYIFGNFVNCVKPSRTIFERRKLNLKIYGFFLRDYFVIIKNIRREIKIVLSSRAIVPLSVKKKSVASSTIFSAQFSPETELRLRRRKVIKTLFIQFFFFFFFTQKSVLTRQND